MLHVVLIAQIFPLSVTDTKLSLLFVAHLVLHVCIVVAACGVEITVVGGRVEAVQDLLVLVIEEVAAHGLVSSALGGLVVRDLPSVADDATAVSDRDRSGDVAPSGPVVTELPLADADSDLIVMEAVLVVTELPLVAAGPRVLLVLVLEVPALTEERSEVTLYSVQPSLTSRDSKPSLLTSWKQ